MVTHSANAQRENACAAGGSCWMITTTYSLMTKLTYYNRKKVYTLILSWKSCMHERNEANLRLWKVNFWYADGKVNLSTVCTFLITNRMNIWERENKILSEPSRTSMRVATINKLIYNLTVKSCWIHRLRNRWSPKNPLLNPAVAVPNVCADVLSQGVLLGGPYFSGDVINEPTQKSKTEKKMLSKYTFITTIEFV